MLMTKPFLDFTKLIMMYSTYSLVEVDGVFAGDDVVDGAAALRCGLAGAGGLLVSLGHCDCRFPISMVD